MLSIKQEQFLKSISKYISEKKYPPSIRELCVLNEFKSTSTVSKYLELLEIEGYIKRYKRVNRGIVIIKSRL